MHEVELSSLLKGEINRIKSALEHADCGRSIVFVVGHPGTGKTSLVDKLCKLQLSPIIAVFHVDDHVDWATEAKTILDRGGSEAEIVPEVNTKAFAKMLAMHSSSPLIIWDGGGEFKDLDRIVKSSNFTSVGYVLIDCAPVEFANRLAARFDKMAVTEKSLGDRERNLESMDSFAATLIDTGGMNLRSPLNELRSFLVSIASVIEAGRLNRTPESSGQ
jgi:adenylate kinase family enzyme